MALQQRAREPDGAADSGWMLPNHDLSSTRANVASPITPATVAQLSLRWSYPIAARTESGAVTATPVVDGGSVYLQDMMSNVAKFTGGEAFVDANDMTAPIQKVMQDAAVTYTLAFYPDSATLDSKRHTLKVEVAH